MILTAEQFGALRAEVWRELEARHGGGDGDGTCEVCAEHIAGCLVDAGNDDHHLFIQSCDACSTNLPGGFDDDDACKKVAAALGWHVRRRFDDHTLQAWRSFVTKPGYPDDTDHVCEWDDEEDRDEFGWGPDNEVELRSMHDTAVLTTP